MITNPLQLLITLGMIMMMMMSIRTPWWQFVWHVTRRRQWRFLLPLGNWPPTVVAAATATATTTASVTTTASAAVTVKAAAVFLCFFFLFLYFLFNAQLLDQHTRVWLGGMRARERMFGSWLSGRSFDSGARVHVLRPIRNVRVYVVVVA